MPADPPMFPLPPHSTPPLTGNPLSQAQLQALAMPVDPSSIFLPYPPFFTMAPFTTLLAQILKRYGSLVSMSKVYGSSPLSFLASMAAFNALTSFHQQPHLAYQALWPSFLPYFPCFHAWRTKMLSEMLQQ